MLRAIIIFSLILFLGSCRRPCPSRVGNFITLSLFNHPSGQSSINSKYNQIDHIERNFSFDTLFSYTPDSTYHIYQFGDLPIDLEDDTATYVLRGDSAIDTLIVSYTISLVYMNNWCRYYPQVNDFKVDYATFDFTSESYSITKGENNVFEIGVKW